MPVYDVFFFWGLKTKFMVGNHRQNTGSGAHQQKMVLDCIGSSLSCIFGHDVRISFTGSKRVGCFVGG